MENHRLITPVENRVADVNPVNFFDSRDRTAIQIINDFGKPLHFFPTILDDDGHFLNGNLYYKKGTDLPFSGKVLRHGEKNDISSEASFLNGLPHGFMRKYFSSGQIASETLWDQGRISGINSTWWENGKLKKEEYWSEGSYHGERNWDEHGRLVRQINMPLD